VHAGIRALHASLQQCAGIQRYVGAPQGCHDARATRISNDRLALAGELLATVAEP
jgi:hypothetical protein